MSSTVSTPSAAVLMSVYYKVEPKALGLCLDSIAAQSRMPEQIVIIKDGPLNTELDQALASFQEKLPKLVTVVSLDKNQGLITALNTGLNYCKGDWIIRMDADDVALPNRIEDQINYLSQHTEVDVLGSAMLEFEYEPSKPLRLKPVVVTHHEIKAQLPYRNPINHPTVCVRTSVLKDIGGYPDLAFLEDYFLWAKLMDAGAKFHNLEVPLYAFRFDSNTLQRRAGYVNFKNECKLRWWMYKHKLMGPLTLISVLALQVVLRFAPFQLRQYLWHASRNKLSI